MEKKATELIPVDVKMPPSRIARTARKEAIERTRAFGFSFSRLAEKRPRRAMEIRKKRVMGAAKSAQGIISYMGWPVSTDEPSENPVRRSNEWRAVLETWLCWR